jgi:mannose-6-phosphate isomerase-like protein (cupin superfamily)
METKTISTNIANGTIHYSDRSENISDIEWSKHPKFNGVYLKNMIQGADTCGLFSSHIVKIDPNCCLETHCHENQMELHEVIEGDGSCKLIEDVFDYHFGKMAVIPKGESHMVQAGENGLTLLAKFFPAML